jgi:hypothetical protein
MIGNKRGKSGSRLSAISVGPRPALDPVEIYSIEVQERRVRVQAHSHLISSHSMRQLLNVAGAHETSSGTNECSSLSSFSVGTAQFTHATRLEMGGIRSHSTFPGAENEAMKRLEERCA